MFSVTVLPTQFSSLILSATEHPPPPGPIRVLLMAPSARTGLYPLRFVSFRFYPVGFLSFWLSFLRLLLHRLRGPRWLCWLWPNGAAQSLCGGV
jgi:hypothetical protein